jgi:hypothetical protein
MPGVLQKSCGRGKMTQTLGVWVISGSGPVGVRQAGEAQPQQFRFVPRRQVESGELHKLSVMHFTPSDLLEVTRPNSRRFQLLPALASLVRSHDERNIFSGLRRPTETTRPCNG